MGCGLTGSLQLVTGQYAVLDGPVGLPGRLHAVLIASQFQISLVGLVLLLLGWHLINMVVIPVATLGILLLGWGDIARRRRRASDAIA